MGKKKTFKKKAVKKEPIVKEVIIEPKTYDVHVYCTNCQKPTMKQIEVGKHVSSLMDKPHVCSYCKCPALGHNDLPYKTVYTC